MALNVLVNHMPIPDSLPDSWIFGYNHGGKGRRWVAPEGRRVAGGAEWPQKV